MIAGGVTVVEVTMTVPGAVELLRELKKEHGDDPARLRHRDYREASRSHYRNRRRVRGQPQPASGSHRCDQSRWQAFHSRRSHSHRSHYRGTRRCRLYKDLSLLRHGGRQLSQVAARTVSAPEAHSHRRRHAANCGELYQSRRPRSRRRRRSGQPGRHRRRQTRKSSRKPRRPICRCWRRCAHNRQAESYSRYAFRTSPTVSSSANSTASSSSMR